MKIRSILLAALAVAAVQSYADVTVGVGESTDPWVGYMNVFALPADGGGFQFGQPWGVPDLVATFDDGANTLTLSPNTIGDPNEYWYQDPTGTGDPNPGGPGAPGNKIMEANLYQENNALNIAGSTLTFEGNILANSFTEAHSTRAFIRDFAPDFSSSVDTFLDITTPGAFSLSYETSGDAGRVIQYGFQTVGENVWVTDTAPFGSVVVETIPEPSSIALLAVAAGGIWGIRRMRR